MATVRDAISAMAEPWWPEIAEARRGNAKPFVDALRSGKPLPDNQRALAWWSANNADALDGKFKRKRGRPPRRNAGIIPRFDELFQRDPQLARAWFFVDEYKRDQKERYGRTHGVEAEAIDKAVAEFGVDGTRLYNLLQDDLLQPRRPSTRKRRK